MLSKKIRNILIFAAIAALFAAVGYWNISPERFLDKPAVRRRRTPSTIMRQRPQRAIPAGRQTAVRNDLRQGRTRQGERSHAADQARPEHVPRHRVPWHVQSERGEVNPGGTEVELIDSVRVTRTDEKNRDTLITTTRMTVFPQQQYAQTEQPVRIDGAGGVSTAKGMKAYLKDSRMTPAIERKRTV